MRVLLADDQPEVRSALRLLLELELGLCATCEAVDAKGLLAQAQSAQPDLVLLDWELPGLRETGLLDGLRARFPRLRVVALSGRPEASREALAAGVDSFVSKGDPPEQLLCALRRVGIGGETP